MTLRYLSCLTLMFIVVGCSSGPEATSTAFLPESTDAPTTSPATNPAQEAFQRGDYKQAVSLYQEALTHSRMMDHPLHIGNDAYNMAAALIELGRYAESRELLLEAELDLVRADEAIADVLLLHAKAARLEGLSTHALSLAKRIERDPRSKPLTRHRVQAMILEGQIACDARDLAQATLMFADASSMIGEVKYPSVQAQFAELDARIAAMEGRNQDAAKARDRQVNYLRAAKWYRHMSQALADAAVEYQQINDRRSAADRWFRAARSASAQANRADAVAWAENALHEARLADAEDLIWQASTLKFHLTGDETDPGYSVQSQADETLILPESGDEPELD